MFNKIIVQTVRRLFIAVWVPGAFLLAGCNPGTPDQEAVRSFVTTGNATALSASEFNALTPEQQYAVANKLYATFYRGIPVDEFFDIQAEGSMTNLVRRQPNFLADTRQALNRNLSPDARLSLKQEIGLFSDDTPIYGDDDLFQFTTNRNANTTTLPRQIPLAQIVEFPISRDLYIEWMTYFLANTIMFSPALEMESTDAKDATFVYNFLRNNIRNGVTVQNTVRAFLGTQSRWRVSRSAENHALEAYELYLGLFDTEEDSRKGGIACRDWKLTSESEQYQMMRSGEPNTEYQRILDNYYVRDCADLYNVIVSHPLFIPRVTEVISNYFFAEMDAATRQNFVRDVVAANPQTFEDIFTAILFSREYLLNSERPMWFEENFFGTLHRLRWSVDRNQGNLGGRVLRELTEYSWSPLYMRNMGNATMEYKIGRTPNVPMDAMSFSSQTKAMREQVLVNNQNGWRGGDYSNNTKGFRGLLYDTAARENTPGELSTVRRPEVVQMTAAEFVDYLFMSSLRRRATDDEQSALIDLMRNEDDGDGLNLFYTNDLGVLTLRPNNNWVINDATQVVFDYVSRLPEFYYHRSVSAGGV
ncbi:hypothetical protein ACFOSD_14405 [Salinispirillum marinum]|uniref:DUF1800 domain-containing protein n=2 Tax=Saccharospirillaceae TaxID=255527 RepID=A0ABV8BH96_9GAMM